MLHIIFPKYDTKDLLSVLRANFMLATINWPWAIIICRFSDVPFVRKEDKIITRIVYSKWDGRPL